MDIQDIIIGILVLVILFILFSRLLNSKEKMANLNNLDMSNQVNKAMCDLTTNRSENIQAYLTNYCKDENKDLPNFKNAINNRTWCRVREEENIVTDINKKSYCQN
jgi:hypothetical protein